VTGGQQIHTNPLVYRMSDGTTITFRPAGKFANKTTGYPPPVINIVISDPTMPYISLKLLP
jgi:hypothetical protein